MSRAFTKESEDTIEKLPDRAISRHRNYVTPEGLAAIELALSRFEKALAEAHAVDDEQAVSNAQRELRYWRSRRVSAEVVLESKEANRVSFGSTVRLRRADGREQKFRIVGEDEADPPNGTISYVSPFARAVMTHGPGDTVELAGGKAEILDVR